MERAESHVRFRGYRHSNVSHCFGCLGIEAMRPLHIVTFTSDADMYALIGSSNKVSP